MESCRIGDRTLIGMGVIVGEKSVVSNECIIAAGSVVQPGTHIPDGQVLFPSFILSLLFSLSNPPFPAHLK